MPLYISRVAPDFSYALEHIEELGQVFKSVSAEIPEKYAAEVIVIRFTFCLIKLSASSRGECAEAIEAAWDRFCPNAGSGVRVITVPFSEDDPGQLIRAVMSSYYGVENYQRLAAELYGSIPLLKQNGSLKALRAQNYLFAVDPGNGFTTLLCSFGDFLRRMGVYEDKSDVKTKYAEFKVSKESNGEYIGESEMISKFYDSYLDDCNAVGIDISWFLMGEKFDELRRFLQRLFRFQDQTVFVFRIPFLEKKAFDRVASVLDDVMITRSVLIPPLHESVLAEHFWDQLRGLGVTPDKTILETFFAKIAKEKSDGRFYGFKTVEKIAGEMVLKKAARDADLLARGGDARINVIAGGDLPDDISDVKRQKSGYDALNDLIGMEKIAEKIREIVYQVKTAMRNDKLDKPCIHMRFLGHPGTGKTTVARIIGQIFREEGILRKGAFLEYSARSLCAEYVGQTAVRTTSICRDAYGSVLFIDEAYALYDGYQSNDYGKEALTTLISEMENHRDDMLVIMAGYTDDMETLMSGNVGLRSRMPYAIHFPNYTKKQLFEIFMQMVEKHFPYTSELKETAEVFFSDLSDEYIASKEFANARFVRNLYERTWSKGALRAALSGAEAFELTKEDFIAACAEKEFSEKLIKKKSKIGF